MSTVWIIRDSMLTKPEIVKTLNHSSVCLLSLVCDEGHTTLRSFDSGRAKVFQSIAKFSHFVCLASGTMFPLGPKHDGIKILTSLGGDCLTPGSTSHKWDKERAAIIRKLYSWGGWSIFRFRKLITPFFLCRTRASMWGNQRIMPDALTIPVPEYIDTHDQEYEKQLMDDFHKTKTATNKDGMVDMNKFKARTDELLLRAWSPIYDEIRKDMTPDEVQATIAERLDSTRRTGRIAELIKIVLMLKQAGQRWIIVADRVFLLALAVYV